MVSNAAAEQALAALRREARGCTRCPQLVAARTQVVFGSGPVDADVMFVGEAPGFGEDAAGAPLTGRAAALLSELLGEVGLAYGDVFLCNALNCRPPDNRDPAPGELDNCSTFLWRRLELVEPVVVCPLGSVATKRLRGATTPLGAVHGVPEVRTLGPRTVRLLPLLHPAAALYAPESVARLRAGVAQLPALLALGAPPQPQPSEPPPGAGGGDDGDDAQLGLF